MPCVGSGRAVTIVVSHRQCVYLALVGKDGRQARCQQFISLHREILGKGGRISVASEHKHTPDKRCDVVSSLNCINQGNTHKQTLPVLAYPTRTGAAPRGGLWPPRSRQEGSCSCACEAPCLATCLQTSANFLRKSVSFWCSPVHFQRRVAASMQVACTFRPSLRTSAPSIDISTLHTAKLTVLSHKPASLSAVAP